MEWIAYLALAFIAGYFIGKCVATHAANKELRAFKEDVRKYGSSPN
jgi:hypothetical protein